MIVDLESWKSKTRFLKREIYALSLTARHPRVPWYAKVFALVIVGYALSPIDLIPDFIPVLGYLDDLILIPLAIALLIKMIPHEVMEECSMRAKTCAVQPGGKRIVVVFIILIWCAIIYFCAKLTLRIIG